MSRAKRTPLSSWAIGLNWDDLMAGPLAADEPRIKSLRQLVQFQNREADRSQVARAKFDEFLAQEQRPEVLLAFALGMSLGHSAGRISALVDIRRLLDEQSKKMYALDKINAGRSVTADERRQALALNAQLESKFPVKTPRYREIANRMKIKYDRVRTLIEGPRKAKSRK